MGESASRSSLDTTATEAEPTSRRYVIRCVKRTSTEEPTFLSGKHHELRRRLSSLPPDGALLRLLSGAGVFAPRPAVLQHYQTETASNALAASILRTIGL